jgi:predicted esterase
MILIMISTLHYTLSHFEKSMNKVTILKRANENPNARVVTSEEAVLIINSLKSSGTDSTQLESVTHRLSAPKIAKISIQGGMSSSEISQMMDRVRGTTPIKAAQQTGDFEMQNLNAATSYMAKQNGMF